MTLHKSESSKRAPTIRDVAAKANVGLATVSRVLNGSTAVAPNTAQRVREAIAALGYRRNEAARMLRPAKQAHSIGMKVGDLMNPFWGRIAMGAVDEASSQGWAVLLGTADEDPRRTEEFIDQLLDRQVAGLITVPDGNEQQYLLDSRRNPKVPLVFLDRPSPGIHADAIVIDNVGGAYRATRQFLDMGHRRVAILVAPSYYTTDQRYRGYCKALTEASIPLDPSLVKNLELGSSKCAERAVEELLTLDSPPTAIFSTTSFLTMGALASLTHYQKPIALIGFDDFQLADQVRRPVSVIKCDEKAIGALAVQLLIKRYNKLEEPPMQHTIPTEYVPRGSGEIPPQP